MDLREKKEDYIWKDQPIIKKCVDRNLIKNIWYIFGFFFILLAYTNIYTTRLIGFILNIPELYLNYNYQMDQIEFIDTAAFLTINTMIPLVLFFIGGHHKELDMDKIYSFYRKDYQLYSNYILLTLYYPKSYTREVKVPYKYIKKYKIKRGLLDLIIKPKTATITFYLRKGVKKQLYLSKNKFKYWYIEKEKIEPLEKILKSKIRT